MKQSRRSAIVLGLIVAAVSLAAVSTEGLRTHVQWLSDPAREGRRAGQPGAVESAQYISRQFEQLGFTVQMQEFGGNRRNVIARSGTAEKYIVLGAHYDGQGAGLPSASDNAAGVAMLFELARDLKAARLPVSLVMVAFDDEEQGLNGSRYYVDHSPLPLESAVAAIVFDSMGRSFIDLQAWTLFILGAEYSKELADVVQRRSRPDMLVAGTDLIGPRSDFAPFAVKRIPYLFFTDGTHKDYHGAGDTPDRINYTRLAQDATLVGQIIRDIAQLKTRPAYLDAPAYPAGELAALFRVMTNLEKERTDLPSAYVLMFADLKARVRADPTRDNMRVAAAALIAIATPRLSSFMLNFILGPFYENANKPEIVAAIGEEARRWQ